MFDKSQYPLMQKKNLKKLGIEAHFLNLITCIIKCDTKTY